MAKFQAYPDYVSSGLKWLGDLPAGWKTERAKLIFNEINERSEDGAEQLLSVSEYYGVKPRSEVIEEGEYLSRAESLEGYKKCQINDLVMNIMLAWKRGLAFTRFAGIVSPAYSVFRLKKRYDPGYLNYLIRTDLYTHLFKRWSTGVIDSRLRLYPEIFGALPVLVPPRPEQSAIATFLDHETAKIDWLIARQERLIELLKEKRQAVISHAVTKGLNPDVPMKDSGVEWLGEVPAHWDVSRIKYVLKKNDGIQMGPFGGMLKDLIYEETGYKLYGQENTISGDFTSGSRWLTKKHYESLANYELLPGDLVLTRKGSLGNCRIVPNSIQPGIIDSDTIRLRIDERKINQDFLQLLLHEAFYIEEQIRKIKRGAILSGLNTSTITDLVCVVPTVDEQLKIMNLLGGRIGKIDLALGKVHAQLVLLEEHRAALISSAVTGKIDVRGWQKPDTKLQETATAVSA